MHYPSPQNGRFTKNHSRNDNELRDEATDYHQRQLYAVPVDAYDGSTAEDSTPRADECYAFDEFIDAIVKTCREHSDPPFRWAK